MKKRYTFDEHTRVIFKAETSKEELEIADFEAVLSASSLDKLLKSIPHETEPWKIVMMAEQIVEDMVDRIHLENLY